VRPIVVCCFAALLCAPPLAQAAFKCKQPNGTTSFQDQPCQDAAAGSALTLPQPSKAPEAPAQASAVASPSSKDKVRESEQRRADDEVKAHNEQVAAQNKMQRCNQARQQLGVMKEGGRVFRRDNAGNRQYVDDKDRGSEIAAAERRVAAECQ
jgi:hypothetical protein